MNLDLTKLDHLELSCLIQLAIEHRDQLAEQHPAMAALANDFAALCDDERNRRFGPAAIAAEVAVLEQLYTGMPDDDDEPAGWTGDKPNQTGQIHVT